MKSFAALSTLLAVASATTPVKQRQAPADPISVTEFSAQTITGGRESFINFNVKIPSGPTTSCSYAGGTAGGQLPPVSLDEGRCEDGSVRWQFSQQPSVPETEGPYRLVVVHHEAGSDSGSQGYKTWDDAARSFPVTGKDPVVRQEYVGPKSFTLEMD